MKTTIVHITVLKDPDLFGASEDIRILCGADRHRARPGYLGNALYIGKLDTLSEFWENARFCKRCDKKSPLHLLAMTEL